MEDHRCEEWKIIDVRNGGSHVLGMEDHMCEELRITGEEDHSSHASGLQKPIFILYV